MEERFGRNFEKILSDFIRLFSRNETSSIIEQLITSSHGDQSKLVTLLETHYGAYGFFESPEKNFSSKFFNPLKALYDDGFTGDPILSPPVLLASPLDNVHKALTLLPPNLASQFDTATIHLGPLHSAEVEALDKDRWKGEPPPLLLEWLIEDAMIASTETNASPFLSSLSWESLRDLCKQRAQVRVTVSLFKENQHIEDKEKEEKRKNEAVIIGYLRGFDRYRNLLLLNHTWEHETDIDKKCHETLRSDFLGSRIVLIRGSDIKNIILLAG